MRCKNVWSPAFRPSENPIALFSNGLKAGLRTLPCRASEGMRDGLYLGARICLNALQKRLESGL